MVCQVTKLRHDGHRWLYRATIGLAGREVTGDLDENANLGDLAKSISDKTPQATLLHLLLPGATETVCPLSCLRKLASL